VIPTLTQLRYLVAVADHLHFRKAAAACHVTQPALTTQIQALEERLGASLVERSKRKVMLTALGREVVARARHILEEAQGIAEIARRARAPLSGPLTLGVIPTIGPYLLPGLLGAVREAFPDLELFLREDQTARLLERLAAGQLDLLLLALPVDAPGVATLPLYDEPFVLAAPPGHPLTRKRRIEQADLAGQEVLLLEDGHCLRDQALAVCAMAGAREGSGFQATSLNTLSQMVANGLGVSLLPLLSADVEARSAPGLVVRRFAKPEPSRRIGLAWRPTSARRAEFELLAQFLSEHLPAGVARRPPSAGTKPVENRV
jgi:LysR family hydrogen peroxide-inducible transcriptional activator